MDHLPAVARREEPIPYLGNDGYEYDQGGFYGYPQRYGIDFQKIFDSGDHEIPPESLNSFVQAWLFYGLLGEFSTIGKEVPLARFYRINENGRFIITTEHLLDYLKDWQNHVTSMSASTREARQMRTVVLLKDAKLIIAKYCSPFPTKESPVKWATVLPLLALSLMVLGETLCWALEQLNIDCPPIKGWDFDDKHGWGNSVTIDERLVRRGWCAHSIHMLKGLLKGSVSGLYYASTFLDSPDFRQGRSHQDCSSSICRSNNLDTGSYRPRHVKPDCNCEYIYPDMKEVVKILQENGMPLFRYIGSYEQRTAKIRVEKRRPGMMYVVISHVWADGLGNPQGNAMVACQLEKLTRHIKALLDYSGGTIYFWIDSIAVPVAPPELRRVAIQQMHEVYSEANKTIVLDADIMRNPLAGYTETAMRITISGWMKRLWTLQEGVMSRSIYFLFEDGLQDIEDLDRMYRNAATRSSVAGAARSFYHNLLRSYDVAQRPNSKVVSAIWKAVQWRRSSKPEDEVLAVARILNVKLDSLLDSTPHERMQALLRNIYEIPPAFIFLPGVRMKDAGFRWAPETWMVGQEIDHPDPLSLPSAPVDFVKGYDIVRSSSVLTPNGLTVRYPGFLLHCLSLEFVILSQYRTDSRFLAFPSSASLHEWYNVECVELSLIDYLLDMQRDLSRISLGIILCRPKPGVNPEIALLVRIDRDFTMKQTSDIIAETQARHAHSICRVKISLIKTLHQDLHKAWREFPDHFFCGEELPPDQVWVVD